MELKLPIGPAITPEMEEQGVKITRERTQIVNEEANMLGRDEELESAIMQARDTEVRSRATNGGLKNETF
jgi:hypothetical protein